MPIQHHYDLIQGTEEWAAARCGLLTASEMKLIITPANLKRANNDKSRSHLYELLAQRITKYVEPAYISDDMLRGQEDEVLARQEYHKKYAPVQCCGFVTNDQWGFTIGYSPDGLIGDDGLIEAKSRRQKYQLEAILNDDMPEEFLMQVQTGLLVSDRKWCDFITYSAGLPMYTKRIYADKRIQNAIIEVAMAFHEELEKLLAVYNARLNDPMARLIPTERRIEKTEITL